MTKYKRGTRVQLVGLANATEHNGQYGLVMSFDGKSDRYCVKLNLSDRTVKVREDNLKDASSADFGVMDTAEFARELVACVQTKADDETVMMTFTVEVALPSTEQQATEDVVTKMPVSRGALNRMKQDTDFKERALRIFWALVRDKMFERRKYSCFLKEACSKPAEDVFSGAPMVDLDSSPPRAHCLMFPICGDPECIQRARQWNVAVQEKTHGKNVLDSKQVFCSQCKTLERDVKFSKCSRCKVVYYCSKECQLTHWKAGHKKVCKPAGSLI